MSLILWNNKGKTALCLRVEMREIRKFFLNNYKNAKAISAMICLL